MSQIVTGLIIAALGFLAFKHNMKPLAIGALAVALLLLWPGSPQIVAPIFSVFLFCLNAAGPALGLLLAATCGMRLMMGLPALPNRFRPFG